MKNFSKKNFTGKNNKEYKKNSDSGYYSKNKNRSEENERFIKNSAKNKNVENLNKIHKNNTFSSPKRRKSIIFIVFIQIFNIFIFSRVVQKSFIFF